MTPAQLALAAAAALLVCARAETYFDSALLKISNIDIATLKTTDESNRTARTYAKNGLPSECLYNGQWYSDGATVMTREECLRCVCLRGALSCRRRACAPLPDPLPRRCHVRHRRASCCPELHCPDGVKIMEHGAVARFENEQVTEPEIATPPSANRACVEGGTVYAAGSAMGAHVACEACFCLHGVRRCVRPSCLPPPPHCAPRPASGACCPQRYYCDRTTDSPSQSHNQYDCLVGDTWVAEGNRVSGGNNCTACFCLRGEVRCQELGCAPPLAGCRPLLALGDCCAHQYVCDHSQQESPTITLQSQDSTLTSLKLDQRAFHTSKSSKIESTTNKIISRIYTSKHSPITSPTKNHLITTTKVKRKTDEPSLSSSQKPDENNSSTISLNTTTTEKPSSAAKLIVVPDKAVSTDATVEKTTEQPEGTVKIVINGTINCTAELSSTSLPLSIVNDTDKIQMQAMPRIPIVNVEAQTYSPNDIITDRNVNDGFDENDTFTINVTSSLITNTSRSTSKPVMTVSKIPTPADLVDSLNSSKKTKGDYDYDYTEPTLPPSLPNLKIIPFVAADAVVDDKPTKDPLAYSIEREDKFPVYYPSANEKDTEFPTRREDTYNPTQYPVFIADKGEPLYPPVDHDVDLTSNRYPFRNELGVHEYTVTTSLGSSSHVVSDLKSASKIPATPTKTTFALETPAINLFSPPVETEGGFVPKGPGIIDEYYAMYPSTPPGPVVPHLTTSMQLDVYKDKCISKDGQHVAEGESIILGCLQCTCTWVELRCAPRPCHAAPGCERHPPAGGQAEACCGDLVCDGDNKHPIAPSKLKIHENKTTVEDNNHTLQELVPQEVQEVVPQRNVTNSVEPDEVKIEVASSIAQNISTVKADNVTEPPTAKTESTSEVTTTAHTTTTKLVPKVTTSTTPVLSTEVDDTSHEYEDDDEVDDEFSFGSVLKLLLSDTYETTTATAVKKLTTRPATQPILPTTQSVRKPSTVAPFIPLPPHPYAPPKKSPNTVNRIDHLVLGEATAIKRTTLRPITNKPTKRPIKETTTERRPEIKEKPTTLVSEHEDPWPPNLGGLQVVPGILKLAGCNIYGRMYRVGRIIAELSTPCQECWCTELGVQCKPLSC